MTQLGFDFTEVMSADQVEPTEFAPLTLQERFERFHAEHPDVFRLFLRFAREAKRKGQQRWGAKAIWERVRWEIGMKTGQSPALNNNWTAYYSRLVMRRFPLEFAGFFETRRVEGDEG